MKKAFFIVFCCWSLGFLLFVYSIYNHSIERIHKADAVIVLTGGAGRIDNGVELLLNNKADKMLITGVSKGTDLYAINSACLKYEKLFLNSIEDRITLGYKADSTLANAQEAKEWIEENDIQSIILVTSYYHMPRSLKQFQNILPDNKIYTYPVLPKVGRCKGLGCYLKRFRLYLLEYNKYIIQYFL